jgi:hypothetical protein
MRVKTCKADRVSKPHWQSCRSAGSRLTPLYDRSNQLCTESVNEGSAVAFANHTRHVNAGLRPGQGRYGRIRAKDTLAIRVSTISWQLSSHLAFVVGSSD